MNKCLYDLKVSEAKALLPSRIQRMCKDLEDYDYVAMMITSITGAVEGSDDRLVFTARGSNQRYALRANEALKKLVAEGKSKVTIAGKVTEPPPGEARIKLLPQIEVTEAKEASK